jgi:hypothetical protein
MANVQELIERAARELGPGASDDEITDKAVEYIEALPEADREEVFRQMAKALTLTQLAHLRENIEGESGAIPEPSPENGGPAGPPA